MSICSLGQSNPDFFTLVGFLVDYQYLKITVMMPSCHGVEKLHGLDFCGWLQMGVQAIPKQLPGIGGKFRTWSIA